MSSSLNIISHAGIPLPDVYAGNKESLILEIKYSQSITNLTGLFSALSASAGSLVFIAPEQVGSPIGLLITAILGTGAFGTASFISYKNKREYKKMLRNLKLENNSLTTGEKRTAISSQKTILFKEAHDYPYVEWDEVFIDYLPSIMKSDIEYKADPKYYSQQTYYVTANNIVGKVFNIAMGVDISLPDKNNYAAICPSFKDASNVNVESNILVVK